MSEPGWAGAGERGRWGPAGRGGKGGGVREGAAEGPLSGGPGVFSVVLSPWWGGGERRESKGHRDRVAVGPVGKWGEGWLSLESWGATGVAGTVRGLKTLLFGNCEG